MINPTSIQLLDGAKWNHFATADLCVFFQSPAFLGFGATSRRKLVSEGGGYWAAAGAGLVKCKKSLQSNGFYDSFLSSGTSRNMWLAANALYRVQWKEAFGFIGKLFYLFWHTSEADYQDMT